jgi:hypothetical protein
MDERTGQRLRNLHGDGRVGVVGKSVILPAAERELRLQEKIVAGHKVACRGNALSDRGLVVVAALVGRVDAAKAGSQGKLGKPLRLIFLPGGAIEEARDRNAVNRHKSIRHRHLGLSAWSPPSPFGRGPG